ncbi:MAG: glycosyltransferase [Bdellovibrionales bacterium]|nr:glycosyltransferase [Bdellovibrionales bacterium]
MLLPNKTMPLTQQRKKVVLLLPTLHLGGAERVTLNLLNGELASQFDLRLWAIRREGFLSDQIPSTIPTTDLRAHGTISALIRLIHEIRLQKPSVLISCLTPANVLAILAVRLAHQSTRVAVVEHGSILTHKGGRSGLEKVLPWLQKQTYRYADQVVAVSKGLAGEISRNTGVPLASVQVLYNPVIRPDFEARAAETVSLPWTQCKNHFVVAMVGRLEAVKDPLLAIKAVAALRRRLDCKFLILGDGSLRSKTEQAIKDLGLSEHAHVMGSISNPLPYLKLANVLLMTSHTEALPTALIEARALGLPVVATDCDWGPRELEKSLGQVTLVRDRNPEQIADALHALQFRPKSFPSTQTLVPFREAQAERAYASLIESMC